MFDAFFLGIVVGVFGTLAGGLFIYWIIAKGMLS